MLSTKLLLICAGLLSAAFFYKKTKPRSNQIRLIMLAVLLLGLLFPQAYLQDTAFVLSGIVALNILIIGVKEKLGLLALTALPVIVLVLVDLFFYEYKEQSKALGFIALAGLAGMLLKIKDWEPVLGLAILKIVFVFIHSAAGQ